MIRAFPLGLALTALFAAAPAPPAHAQAPPVRELFSKDSGKVVQQTRLDASGLDLSRDQDIQTLMERIEDAARAVCEARPPGGPEPWVTPEQIQCRRQVMGETAYKFHNPQLWALAVEQVRALGPSF
jgi:UrcA family protein